MFETYGAALIAIGLALMVFCLLWTVVRAFRYRPIWGFAAATGIGLPFFVYWHAARVRVPATLFVVGLLLFGVPLVYNRYAPPDLGPREKVVDGELHITLTGWNPDKAGYRRWISWLNLQLAGQDPLDYSMLRAKPGTAVLQMANADVSDATLDYLSAMTELYEIDLNDTQVTDAGLAKLAKLPRLKTLRLRGTKITDDGFRTQLMPLERLMELDLSNTAVKSATARDWKAAKEGRRALK